MAEINVMLMLFDEEKRVFSGLRLISLPAVPTKGDKISLNDENSQGQIYLVYDVHYCENGIDVNIIHLGSITDYYGSGYPDIKTTGNDVWWSA
jgi:hypothetical protein